MGKVVIRSTESGQFDNEQTTRYGVGECDPKGSAIERFGRIAYATQRVGPDRFRWGRVWCADSKAGDLTMCRLLGKVRPTI